MNYEIVAQPSYTALKCILQLGEKVHCESGAMLAMDSTASISGGVKGGIWKAIKRSILTSESFFVTTITGQKDNTEVYLAPRATGDIEGIALNGNEYIVQGGGFLAAEEGITTDSHFTGWKGFLSGEGLFMIQASGNGNMFVSSFGGILKKELKSGEKFVVDNGHLVGFPANMKYDIQKVGADVVNMVTTGEGLAIVLEGPGTILLQTRNLRTFAETLNPFLPSRERSQGKGIFSDIMGG